jgi:hypothetical protein
MALWKSQMGTTGQDKTPKHVSSLVKLATHEVRLQCGARSNIQYKVLPVSMTGLKLAKASLNRFDLSRD